MAEQQENLKNATALKIVQVGDAVLRSQARPLNADEVRSKEIQQLIEWMRQTMYDAPGVGLAAPQVGLPLQLAVIEDKREYMQDTPIETLKERERQPVPFHVIVNPRITSYGSRIVTFFEGCLSLNGFVALVPRSSQVTVECMDHRGERQTIQASGWHARILQHEIGHLMGELYIDRMISRSFSTVESFNRNWKAKTIAEVQQSLDLKS
ncbi:MAG: peptide deformylase [Bryobacterales bacterium]|nr:peptide deformylase [Bryobacterales bacterium]